MLTLTLLVASVVLPALNAARQPAVFIDCLPPLEPFKALGARPWRDSFMELWVVSRELPGYLDENLVALPKEPLSIDSIFQDRLSIGFPFTSLCAVTSSLDQEADLPRYTFTPSGWFIGGTAKYLLIVEPPRGTTSGDSILIPATPNWPGLIANTIFWGLVAWFIQFGVKRLRIARRRVNSLCTHCAFPVDQLPRCPECGQPHLTAAS